MKPSGWPDAFACDCNIAEDLRDEFGTDACRIAAISCEKSSSSAVEDLLEPSFKWLAKLFTQFSKPAGNFSPAPWLEAAFISRDLILQQNRYRTALTLVRKAARLSPPGSNISRPESALVTACLYPFAPVLAMYLTNQAQPTPATLPALAANFPHLVCIRFALENGGWHQKVFDRRIFADNPLQQLMQVKLVHKAVGNRTARLDETEDGLRICLC